MHRILTLLLLLTGLNTASAQKVYSVKYENQADVKVFVVKYENQADLKVYKVKYENQAVKTTANGFSPNMKTSPKRRFSLWIMRTRLI